MNRITSKLQEQPEILSIYFTAGFPNLDDTRQIIVDLEKGGADMIEIGLPFSDPLADGPTIQRSSEKALENGMTTQLLFDQLSDIRNEVEIPLILMAYFNPILQYGVGRFCQSCKEIGIDGLILPDLPLEVFERDYKQIFDEHGLFNIFLITPQTEDERIHQIDKISNGFIYMVSTASTTGKTKDFGEDQLAYFERIAKMGLKSPLLTGFGIHDRNTFKKAVKNSHGAIIGSAFIKDLGNSGLGNIKNFLKGIR